MLWWKCILALSSFCANIGFCQNNYFNRSGSKNCWCKATIKNQEKDLTPNYTRLERFPEDLALQPSSGRATDSLSVGEQLDYQFAWSLWQKMYIFWPNIYIYIFFLDIYIYVCVWLCMIHCMILCPPACPRSFEALRGSFFQSWRSPPGRKPRPPKRPQNKINRINCGAQRLFRLKPTGLVESAQRAPDKSIEAMALCKGTFRSQQQKIGLLKLAQQTIVQSPCRTFQVATSE